MRHWLQLSTRAWRTRPGRTALTVLAVTLGVGVVVWVTCCYESVRLAMNRVVLEWIGAAHVMVEPVEGVWAVFSEDLEPQIAALPLVAHTTTRTREYVNAAPARPNQPEAPSKSDLYVRIEVTGVVPEKESAFRTYKLKEGRFLEPGDGGVIVLEKLLADEFELGVGGRIWLRGLREDEPARSYTIVGIMDRRRASVNQAPMTWAPLKEVQSLVKLPGKIKGVDVKLKDGGVGTIQKAAAEIREVIERRNAIRVRAKEGAESLQVKTTETHQKKLGAAQGMLQFIMLLLSSVVLLTALFTIIASMSMGVTERIIELGLLRCIGVTRRQIAGLIMLQSFPPGIVGTALGLGGGLALHALTIAVAPEYLGDLVFSPGGIWLGVFGGLATTILGAVLPAVSAMRVSPVEAVRALPGERLLGVVGWIALAGAALLGGHEFLQRNVARGESSTFDVIAITSVVALYAGFALVTPLIIVVFGKLAVRIAAFALRLRPQLLEGEIDKAAFRSAAICCGLAVGLSLIVGLIVWGQSIKEGWSFPKEFPDAMLYSYDALPLERVQALADTPGIKDFTVCDDFAFSLSRPTRLALWKTLSALEASSRFLAIDPDRGLDIVQLSFLEGNEPEARAKLKAGGHILVSREFAQARNKHLGDKLEIWAEDQNATFTIAGVVGSPGIDIAISFFNATEYFQFYAVGAIFGTLDDANRIFGRRYGKMMLFNFDPVVVGSEKTIRPETDAELQRLKPASPGLRQTFALGPGPLPEAGPEEAIVNRMLKRLGMPSKAFVTARELKTQIDSNINRVTLLLSSIPALGLLIAALGVANLMAANVASRSRQIAVLRAIGVTQRQMARMVIGEALVLGLLGSLMGVGLGFLLARASNTLTAALSGFTPVFSIRWDLVMGGAVLATVLCILAALLPALRASRTRIVAVLAAN